MQMKRKETYARLTHEFSTVSIYRTDLDEILEISKTRGFYVKISDENYEYESIEELQNKQGNRILNLHLAICEEDPATDEIARIRANVEVIIKKNGVTITSPKKDNHVPIWQEIKDIIIKRESWYTKFMSPLGWSWMAITLLWISPRKNELHDLQHSEIFIWFGCFFFLISMMIFSFFYQRINRGVYLQHKHEIIGFWERYGEKMVMMGLGSILTILGKIATDFFSK
jgi:hypothetical protein